MRQANRMIEFLYVQQKEDQIYLAEQVIGIYRK
jgi:hypothetical protein